MTTTTKPFRITIILDEEKGHVAQVEQMHRILGDGGEILAAKLLPAESLSLPLSAEIVGDVAAALLAEIDALKITHADELAAAKGLPKPPTAPPKTVDVGGLSLRAETEDRVLFTQLLVMLNEAERFGALPAAVNISDADGILHELPTAQVRQLLVGYGSALNAEWTAAKKAEPKNQPNP